METRQEARYASSLPGADGQFFGSKILTLTRTGIFGNFSDPFGASEWFGSVSQSERNQTCVLFYIPHCLTECTGCPVTNFRTSIRSVRSNSAAFAPDLVLPLQVAYDVGLRRFLYQNQPFRRDEDFSC